MAERMFGLETEYAITGIEGNQSVDRGMLVERLLDVARKRLPSLPDAQSSGIFLANGSRLYIDCGLHPELSTPECTNPWDAVRYLKAGEQIIDGIIGQLKSEVDDGTEILCFRCNVDYVAHATWGCHESFLHRCDPSVLPKHIIPHLVSRTIYTGAGGFDPFSSGLDFTLSPRAAHIAQVTSSSSTGDRGIFHTKDEPLSAHGYHRLHILCGESLCSELASWLKVGTTALVVAMIEAGLEPGCGVELEEPVAALRSIVADARCQAMLKLAGGRAASALQVQHHYLGTAESHLGDPFMPPWAGEVCRQWRRILDLLEKRSPRLHTMLDWAMKQAIYARHVESSGMPWEALHACKHVAGRLKAALNGSRRRCSFRPDFILGPNSPILEEVARLTPYVRKSGLTWDRLETFLQLRQELLEIDMRFGQLGEKGVFHSLDRTGLLEHHVDGVDNIEHAISNPPAVGRARIRGEAVRRFAGKSDKPRCNWCGIYDQEGRRLLDLADPFVTEERWESADKREMEFGESNMLPFPDLPAFLRGSVRRRA